MGARWHAAGWLTLTPFTTPGEGDVNPYPGPKNWGPDSPISWLPEEEMEGYEGMVREQWPEYPAPISE